MFGNVRVPNGNPFEQELLRRIAALERAVATIPRIEIPQPETTGVIAIYATNAGQSFASGAAAAIINFGVQVYDPLGLVTTGANWAFTCPVAGVYLVAAHVMFESTTNWTPGERGLLQTCLNGAITDTLARFDIHPSGVATLMALGGAAMLACNQGDTIDVRLAQNSGSALMLDANINNNRVAIARII